jgi:hypothetical protein
VKDLTAVLRIEYVLTILTLIRFIVLRVSEGVLDNCQPEQPSECAATRSDT